MLCLTRLFSSQENIEKSFANELFPVPCVPMTTVNFPISTSADEIGPKSLIIRRVVIKESVLLQK